MTRITKLICVLILCLFGVKSANSAVEQVHATFENPSNTNTTWDSTTRTFTWTKTYYNQLRNIGLPNGDISNYKKLVVDCNIISGERLRILFYKGDSNLTLYANDGVNVFLIKDELEAIAPNDYNKYLLACDEICISGNNEVAPGEAVINDVYLETYPQGEKPDIPDIIDSSRPTITEVSIYGGNSSPYPDYTWTYYPFEQQNDSTFTGIIGNDAPRYFKLKVKWIEKDGDPVQETNLDWQLNIVGPKYAGESAVSYNEAYYCLEQSQTVYSQLGYSGYNVTASWTPGANPKEGWTLSFVGIPLIAEPSITALHAYPTGMSLTANLSKESNYIYTGILDFEENGTFYGSDANLSFEVKHDISEDWLEPTETNKITYVAPEGWIVGNTLMHSQTGYQSYSVTAEWVPSRYYNKGWTLTIDGNVATSITTVGTDATPSVWYDMRGNRYDRPQPGLNIVRMSDGTTRKVVFK